MIRRICFLVAACISFSISFSQAYRNEWITDFTKTYYKFKVATDGVYRINQTSLPAAIASNNVADYKLWRNGVEVPIYTSVQTGSLTASDYIEFWGYAQDGKPDSDLYLDPTYQTNDIVNLYTDTASYFLTVNPSGSNLRLTPTTNNLTSPGTPKPYFINTIQGGQRFQLWGGDAQYISGVYVRSSSYDKNEGWVSGSFLDQKFSLPNLKAYTGTGAPTMQFTHTGGGYYINYRYVNTAIGAVDTLINQTFNSYFDNYKVDVSNLPISKLKNDSLYVHIYSSAYPDAQSGKLLQATWKFKYPRTFDFGNQQSFAFDLPADATGTYLEISNFNSGGFTPVLVDLTNGLRYNCTVAAGIVKVKTLATAVARKMVLYSGDPSIVKNVTSFTNRNFVNYAQTANQGDFLFIANTILNSGGANNQVENYRLYRSSAAGGSYNAKTCDIDELTDQFAFGIRKNPLAIRNFLRYARATFATAPKFVLLMGHGLSYDEYLGNKTSPNAETLDMMPTWGFPGSDILLSAASNATPVPATPIGRLSVVNGDELKIYLDKVKEFDTLQTSTINSEVNKEWKKNTLQLIGASDPTAGGLIEGYMNSYKAIMQDTLIGSNVSTYERTNNPHISLDQIAVANIINNGVPFINYFGHSSSSSLDFNIENPSNYTNTGGKYPIFLTNGCNAGNFFVYDDGRMVGSAASYAVSERFNSAVERGSVGFISSTHFGVLNTLDYLNKEFCNALAKTRYGKSVGEVHQKANDSTWKQYAGDFFTRLTLEEVTLNGDPSLKIFSMAKPDYVIEAQNISYSPSFVSVSTDSISVNLRVHNIGKTSNDSIVVRLQRTTPDGVTKIVGTTKLKPLKTVDSSIIIKFPIVGNKEAGTNYLIATLDPANLIDEISETNNTATIPFVISPDEVTPVYPYNFAIETKSVFKLKASTADPLQQSRTYRFQMDTTELFNSPLLATTDKTQVGGLIECTPPVSSLVDGKVYYWRVAPVIAGVPTNYRTSSFYYNPTSTYGWNQSHLYQNLKSTMSRITLDSTKRTYSYTNNLNNLFITNSIYPYSGTEDSHFSIVVNGDEKILSACVGHSVIFNVFDTTEFQPFVNNNGSGGFMGSGATCIPTRKYNYEFQYTNSTVRKQMMDFMNWIPNGYFVTARLICDVESYDGNGIPQFPTSLASVWKSDTTLYGNGQSLYHYLYNQGAKNLDSINKVTGRTWLFVYKKNDSTNFTPVFTYSDGIYDRITKSVDCKTLDTLGIITSPKFGPAKAWQQVHWRGHSVETSAPYPDSVILQVIGVTSAGVETVLKTLNRTQQDSSISDISATTYPYIKLKLYNQDILNSSPYQLDYLRLNYLPVPEGALAPNVYSVIKDSTTFDNASQSYKYNFGIAFKNISDTSFDSVQVKLKIIDTNGVTKIISTPKLKPIVSGDTATIYYQINADSLSGVYNLFIDVNPDNNQPEQFHFNNTLYKSFVAYKPDLGICSGSNKSFASGSPGGGNTYQWQINTGTGYTNISNGGIYGGATNDTLKLTAPATSMTGTKYRCAITNTGNTTYGPEYTLKFAITWTGGTSTAWETSSNWSCGSLPDQYTDVFINAGTTFSPVVNVNGACHSLKLMAGTTVTIKPNVQINITGKPGN